MILFWLFGCFGVWLAPVAGQGQIYDSKDPQYNQNNYNNPDTFNNQLGTQFNPQTGNPYNPQDPNFNNGGQPQDPLYNPQGTYINNNNNNQDQFYNNNNNNNNNNNRDPAGSGFGNNPYNGDGGYYSPNDVLYDLKCPEHWVQYYQSCYRFIKSPLKPYHDARKICQAFADRGASDLVSIDNSDEHGFLINQLSRVDPQHRRWYVGAHQSSPNVWVNVNNAQMVNVENAILPDADRYGKDFLAYNFSRTRLHWRFEAVRGDEPLLYVCEAQIQAVQRLVSEPLPITYGVEIVNPERIPRGPYFVKQPVDATFDTFKRQIYNDISVSCLAGGYPTPEYKWFRESYENDRLIAEEINPLSDGRYTISGGMLIIHDPKQNLDHATYHCKASNRFGTIISESVQLNFGFILEFVLKRSPEAGDQNWGKAIYCDPPNHFPTVRYSWSRGYFPNFVEEDKRVFVSNDGALYFSALETIDKANYSCSVQAEFSESGRNGPFFNLMVNPHSSYQQLKFPNNFPKAFPDAPIAGREVRLECVAFGYPVPSYNWTRRNGELPRSAALSSYNRVLTIPKVRVEDQGEYICRAYNDRLSIDNSVILNIQAEPNFTIPLSDKHVDSKSELIWTCEAFGVPDVNYTWHKNGRQLVMGYFDEEDRGRIHVQDNVLTIKFVDIERDPGMYQCRAANTLGTRYSSAQLRVMAFKPTFKKKPLELETYAAEQGNVTIKCNPEAAPKPRFTWQKDGNVIATGGHRRILKNGNLLINSVSRDDEGVYTCRATNELGMDESRGRLIVLRGPRMVVHLSPRIVTTIKRFISLQCEAYTEEMLDIAYIWTHNGMEIRDLEVKNSNNRLRVEGGYLSIINTTFTDAGDYECIVKSTVGTISSKSSIIIEGPPGPPGGVQVAIQKDYVKLSWTDGANHGSPITRYTISGRTNWNQTWVNITTVDDATEINRYTDQKQASIDNVLTPWSVYEFQIAAWNNWGMGPPSAKSPRHSTLADKPYIAPDNIGGGGGKIGDLTIFWTPLRSDQQNAPGIYYKVFWKRKNHDAEFASLELKEFGNTGMAVVHIPLGNYYTEYVVKVQPINDVGAGPISHEVTVFSAEDMPQVAPQSVYGMSYNSTALNLTWSPLNQTREIVRGKLIGHRIKYWPKDGAPEQAAVYYLSRTTRPWALIVGLQPDTTYYVKVMAYNSAGEGPESERIIERTYRKAPQKPPSSVHVYGINPSTVKVVWRYVQPSLEEEPLKGYKIRIWEFDQDLSTANDTIKPFGGKLEQYVDNLSPGKIYRLRVLAYSHGGDGRMSSPEVIFQMGPPASYQSGASAGVAPLVTIALTCLLQLFLLMRTKY